MKIKNFLLVLIFVQISLFVYSQGVDRYGRMTTGMQTLDQSQRDLLTSPPAGLMIWCSNCGIRGELQVYDGVMWINATGDPAANVPPKIGDIYQGRIVFDTYIDGSGETHGLIASAADLAMTTWDNRLTAAAYTGGGYTDWRLPHTSEFVKLYNNRNLSGLAGTFQSSSSAYLYWPSNNRSDNYATAFSFYSGSEASGYKYYNQSIRVLGLFRKALVCLIES